MLSWVWLLIWQHIMNRIGANEWRFENGGKRDVFGALGLETRHKYAVRLKHKRWQFQTHLEVRVSLQLWDKFECQNSPMHGLSFVGNFKCLTHSKNEGEDMWMLSQIQVWELVSKHVPWIFGKLLKHFKVVCKTNGLRKTNTEQSDGGGA